MFVKLEAVVPEEGHVVAISHKIIRVPHKIINVLMVAV
jgi:hypothetical protein